MNIISALFGSAYAVSHLDTLLERELDQGLSELSLSPGDRTKKRATSARDELLAEMEELDGEDLAADGRILKLEKALSEERKSKEQRAVKRAECKALIAVLDRAKSDIEALGNPPPQPSKTKSRKAREAA
jgi:hypothetical protein